MMNRWMDVCSVNDLQPDSGVCALAASRQVAIFYLSKTQSVYALSNYDPFCQANVLSRGMVGDIGGKPMVASPMYKQHFHLETGVCFEDENIRIPHWRVRIEKDRVLLEIPR